MQEAAVRSPGADDTRRLRRKPKFVPVTDAAGNVSPRTKLAVSTRDCRILVATGNIGERCFKVGQRCGRFAAADWAAPSRPSSAKDPRRTAHSAPKVVCNAKPLRCRP